MHQRTLVVATWPDVLKQPRLIRIKIALQYFREATELSVCAARIKDAWKQAKSTIISIVEVSREGQSAQR